MEPTSISEPALTGSEREQLLVSRHGAAIVVLCEGLKGLLAMTAPEDIPTLMASIMANTFGLMTDACFQSARQKANTPCGEPGCECHIQQSALMDALEFQRDRFIARSRQGQVVHFQKLT